MKANDAKSMSGNFGRLTDLAAQSRWRWSGGVNASAGCRLRGVDYV